nr:hypothetical protein CFP56_68622 [Quercus suber]
MQPLALNVVGSTCCASCKSECEDVVHALWGCASLILIWETNEVVMKLLRRNSAWVGEASIKVNQIRKKAEEFLHDFQKANGSKVHHPLMPASLVCWTPPNFLLYKVNFDGATFSKIGAAGLGAVVCDPAGNVFGAMIERVQLPSSPVVVEALACRRALFFAKELSIFEISVEGDVEVIIKAILAGDIANPKYGHVICDILSVAVDFVLVISLM